MFVFQVLLAAAAASAAVYSDFLLIGVGLAGSPRLSPLNSMAAAAAL